jgi:hypothetical protein
MNIVMFGCVRPGLDHDEEHEDSDDAYFINTEDGGLYGNGKNGDHPLELTSNPYPQKDRVGALLDLDAGWLRFYLNGKRCGPGFTEGVTGPLVRAATMFYLGDELTALPGAVAPDGAGGDDEPWAEPEPKPESD